MDERGFVIELWVGANLDERLTLGSGSLGGLRAALVRWASAPPVSHVSPDPPQLGDRRRVWIFLDEAAAAERNARQAAKHPMSDYDLLSGADLAPDYTPGWHENEGYGLVLLGDGAALAPRLIRSGAVRTDADYADPLTAGEGLQAHLVRTVVEGVEGKEMNPYLARGWRIIGVNYRGRLDEAGILVGRSAQFVLGHFEADAL